MPEHAISPAAKQRPRRPKMGAEGRRLWEAVWATYDLDDFEVPPLVQACRLADTVAELEATIAAEGMTVAGSKGQPVLHPAVSELRQSRMAVARLLGQIAFPTGVGSDGRAGSGSPDHPTPPIGLTAKQRQAVKAARARWGTHGSSAS